MANKFMEEAINLSIDNEEGGPFGAVVVLDGEIIGRGRNKVTSSNDPTAHAEMVAIRSACQNIGSFSLENAEIYSSCEPCPMCLAAIYWARIRKIYYANTRGDAAAIGFDDSYIYDQISLDVKDRDMPMEQMLQEEAKTAFTNWQLNTNKIKY